MAFRKLVCAVLLATSATVVAAEQQDDAATYDPWEGLNRTIFSFNETVDTYALKPLAQGYRFVAPDFVETGVSNFFDNLSTVGTLVNNVLQGKFSDATSDIARLVFNTTIGLAGTIDVATPMGIPRNDEDFGQTLGAWGVPSGPYVVLPLFGPSTVRDGVSLVADSAIDPVMNVDHTATKNALIISRIIDTRAELLDQESIITGDRYSFMRDAYLQRRKFAIDDGDSENFDDSNF